MKKLYEYLINHYIVTLVFLSLIAVTLCGVGNILIASIIGIILCTAGIMQGAITIDLWILIPATIFNLFSILSSYHTYGTIVAGFAPTQLLFTMLYIVISYLDNHERKILKQLCVAWVGCTAILGLTELCIKAQTNHIGRLGGLLGNPNAFGIFLVLGWFTLIAEESESKYSKLWEPIILASLGATLSMGSFISMICGLLVIGLNKWKSSGIHQALIHIGQILAKVAIGVSIGILLYISGRNTDIPWICFLILIYLLVLAIDWNNIDKLLIEKHQITNLIDILGLLLAGIAIILRPSAKDTFTERIKMMYSGIQYITKSPLLGIGPYQWRRLDYTDGGIYFNTWHIHNLFIHIGVELGIIAMLAVLAVVVRCFIKHKDTKAEFTAFIAHCMIDTGFFYETIPILAILTVSNPKNRGKQLSSLISKAIFIVHGTIFIYNMLHVFL